MGGLLSGLGDLGLGNLESADIFSQEEKKRDVAEKKVAAKPVVNEEDLVYDKEFECPVCSKKFNSKIMKTGKAKQIGSDPDFRPRYEGIDATKYDVVLCPKCGYAALGRYFSQLLPAQAKLIKENISAKVKLTQYNEPVYSFEQALERYKLALACAVVKRSKISERAFICLKTGWLMRSRKEELTEQNADEDKIKEVNAAENEYLENAYRGFLDARMKESFPIAGMDSAVLDLLLAQLAFRFGEYDNAMRMVGGLLTSPCNERIKNKARDLKEQIAAAKKT